MKIITIDVDQLYDIIGTYDGIQIEGIQIKIKDSIRKENLFDILHRYDNEEYWEADEDDDDDDNDDGIKRMTFDEFDEEYGVEENQYNEDSNMYSYGENDEEDLKIETTDEHNIWTVVYVDDKTIIIPGNHYVNRVGYYITEKKWTDTDIEVYDE